MAIEVRAVGADEVTAAGTLLGRAFRDSPGYGAILAHLDEDRRARAITRAKLGFTKAAVRHQVAEGAWVDGRLAAVALTTAPGQWPLPARVFVHHVRACVPAGPRAIVNFLRADGHMGRHHPKAPHHYLYVLGVDPPMQGRGLGKALLARLSARADADGVPCYLETDKERNVRLYESAGYRVVTDEPVTTKPAFRMWTMMRPALNR
jgi:ribosomal protein S18 acetylase RimI-like enzyme